MGLFYIIKQHDLILMKKIIFLIFVSLIFTSCTKQEITIKLKTIQPGNENPDPDQPAGAEYYITFKEDGRAVSLTEVSGSRGLASPRLLTIEGTANGGAAPKFKFVHEESFIGFVPGLNVISSNISYPSDYVQYTNSSNVLYATEYDPNGIHLFISAISYTNGGVVTGIFNGSIKTKDGAAVQITDGKFKVKFKN